MTNMTDPAVDRPVGDVGVTGQGLTKQYIPFAYSANCKRNKNVGLPFFGDNIGDDLFIILLAMVLFSAAPLWVALSIIAFHFSFWTIYEIGYFENDLVAATVEADAKVPPAFAEYRNRFSEPNAWLWAIGLGVLGSIFATMSGVSHFSTEAAGFSATTASVVFAVWMALLAILRGVYRIYNHVDKMTRTHLYLPLQLLKYGFPIAIFIAPAAGVLLMAAQVMRRWLPYVVYRYSRRKPEFFPARMMRFLVFTTLWLLMLSTGPSENLGLHGAIIFVWLGFRSASQLRAEFKNARPVAEDTWKRSDFGGAGQDKT